MEKSDEKKSSLNCTDSNEIPENGITMEKIDNNDEKESSITTGTDEDSENESAMETDTINYLTDDSLLEIFSYLTIFDIIKVEKVCQRWKHLCQPSWRTLKSLDFCGSYWEFRKKGFDRRIMYEGKGMDNFREVLESCGHFIEYYHLDCSILDEVRKKMFATVLELCKNIRDVRIDELTPSLVRPIADNWKDLVKLEIKSLRVTEDNLYEILGNNKKLKCFRLCTSNYKQVTGKFLEYLPADVIQEIRLDGIGHQEISSETFTLALQKFSCLRSLSRDYLKCLDNTIMEAIGKMTPLTYLSLRSVRHYESDTTINSIANLVNLKKLVLSHNYELQDDNLITICKNCKQLEILGIRGCEKITDKGIFHIAELTKLRILDIHGLKKVSDEPLSYLSDTLEVLICFRNKKIKDAGIIALIKKSSNLKILRLTNCGVTRATIHAAIEILHERENGVLRMNVKDTCIPDSEQIDMPYLEFYDEVGNLSFDTFFNPH